ncbi:hypothetical protein J6590_063705 [Homalodisca vitripennis]|nr:hypothetical protein J6590_063705 [Homalodisca vitripennis]
MAPLFQDLLRNTYASVVIESQAKYLPSFKRYTIDGTSLPREREALSLSRYMSTHNDSGFMKMPIEKPSLV